MNWILLAIKQARLWSPLLLGKKKCHNSYNGDLKLLPRFLHPQEIWEQREHPSLDKFGQNKMRDVFSSNDQCFAGVIGEKFHF